MIENKRQFQTHIDRFLENGEIESLQAAMDELDDYEKPKNKGGSTESFRQHKLSMILNLFNAIDNKLIVDFNFEDMPALAIAPPPESGLPAGIDPASVENLDYRKAFEEDIRKNNLKKDKYKFQRKLHKINELTLEVFEEHIESHYSRYVGDLAEIQTNVEQIVTSARRRAELLEILMRGGNNQEF